MSALERILAGLWVPFSVAPSSRRRGGEGLDAFVRNTPDLAAVVDAEGRILYEGPSVRAMFGCAAGELAGGRLWRLVHPDDLARVRKAFRGVRGEAGAAQAVEARVRREDGSWRWVEAVGSNRLRDPNLRAISITARDVTDRKEAEYLRRQRDLLEGVISAQGGTARGILAEEDGRIRYANAAFCELSGYGREELEVMTALDELVPEEERPALVLHRRRGAGDGSYLPTVLRRKDGRRVDVEVAFGASEAAGHHRTVALVREAVDRVLDGERVRLQARLLDALGEAVVATDVRGRVTFWNRAAERLYGWSAAETTGRQLRHFLALDELHEPADETVAGLSGGRAWSGTFVVRRKDGTSLPVQVTETPVHDEGDNVVGMVGVSTDVSEREEAVRALRQSELRFRRAFEDAGIGMALLKPDGRYLQANRALCEIVGYTEAELLDKTFREITHPDDLEQGLEINRIMLRGDARSTSIEKRYVRKDGSAVWAHLTVSMLRDTSDEPLYYISLVQDITERKKTEAALKESEARYRSLVEQIPAIIYVEAVDEGETKWDMLYVSPQQEELLGFSTEEWMSDSRLWQRLLHPDDRERVMAEDERTDRTGEPFRIDYRFIARDGRTVWVRDEALLVHDDDGRPLFWQGVMYDITEQKRVEEEIQRLNEGLERRVAERTAQLEAYAGRLAASNRELQDFAYVASHDLQEPLRKVLAFGERLRTRSADVLDERGLDYLGRMEDAAGRMQKLVQDLLVLSRVTTRARPFEPVDLKEVVDEVLSDLEARLEETGGTVEVGELPTLEADRSQMRQLLQNLIGNALKFHKEGRPPSVKVFGEPLGGLGEGGASPADGGVYRLVVEDDGIGFDERYLDGIFAPFERLHGRGAYEGTGMGLAICRKVVERHGGEITARSSPGEGSAFVVTLPARQYEDEGEPNRAGS